MKRLVILGGGESGVGTAILAKQKGWSVFLSDRGALNPNTATSYPAKTSTTKKALTTKPAYSLPTA